LEVGLQGIPPFLLALYSVRHRLSLRRLAQAKQAFAPQRDRVFATLFQTNLVGYLTFGADAGGAFLLGVFASPTQVAYYGIATQLTRPFRILQNNITSVIVPEIVSLWGKEQVRRVYTLVKSYSSWAFVVGAVGALMLALLAKPLLLIIAPPGYLPALPVIYISLLTVYLNISSLPFYSLALCLDRLKSRNLILAVQLVYLAVAVAVGLSAVTLAWTQASGSLTVRLLNDLPLFQHIKRLVVSTEAANPVSASYRIGSDSKR
jgi:O-antigen/teichoic acid export membrane protein